MNQALQGNYRGKMNPETLVIKTYRPNLRQRSALANQQLTRQTDRR